MNSLKEWYFGPGPEPSITSLSARDLQNIYPLQRNLDQKFSAFIDLLECKKNSFNFGQEVKSDGALFVGEGNLSFSLSVAKQASVEASNIVATTLETSNLLSKETLKNATSLRQLGARVLHGVDATRLSDRLAKRSYGLIVFQFPNVGSRSPIYGRNPNHILLRRFLRNATPYLGRSGTVAITIVNTPFYLGAFNLPELARIAGFKEPEIYPFRPKDFPKYRHTNTHGPDSAISRYHTFSTWVLRPKASAKAW